MSASWASVRWSLTTTCSPGASDPPLCTAVISDHSSFCRPMSTYSHCARSPTTLKTSGRLSRSSTASLGTCSLSWWTQPAISAWANMPGRKRPPSFRKRRITSQVRLAWSRFGLMTSTSTRSVSPVAGTAPRPGGRSRGCRDRPRGHSRPLPADQCCRWNRSGFPPRPSRPARSHPLDDAVEGCADLTVFQVEEGAVLGHARLGQPRALLVDLLAERALLERPKLQLQHLRLVRLAASSPRASRSSSARLPAV